MNNIDKELLSYLRSLDKYYNDSYIDRTVGLYFIEGTAGWCCLQEGYVTVYSSLHPKCTYMNVTWKGLWFRFLHRKFLPAKLVI